MFAFLFLSSGLQKLQTFNLEDGGVAMTLMRPRMDDAQRSFKQLTKVVIQKFQLPVEHKEVIKYITLPSAYYPHALGVAIFLEVVGSLLFVLNRRIGAWMLVWLGVGECVVGMHTNHHMLYVVLWACTAKEQQQPRHIATTRRCFSRQ